MTTTKRLSYALPIIALGLLAADPAFAQSTTGGAGNLTTFLNNVVNLMTGTLGQALAVAALALTGIMVMFGMASFRHFGGVVLGVALLFSAAWVMGQITGGGL